MGWLFLLHPRIGFLNVYLRQFVAEDLKINIATPVGMGWVEGITLAPVVFIMVAANLRMADTTLEEAAKAAGANGWQLFKSIILPLSTPATWRRRFTSPPSPSHPSTCPRSSACPIACTLSAHLSRGFGAASGISAVWAARRSEHLAHFDRQLAVACGICARSPRQPLSAGQRQRLPAAALPLGKWNRCAALFVVLYFSVQMFVPVGLLLWVAFQPFVQPPPSKRLDN